MVGPNTRTKRFWSADEDLRLIIGLNRHFEAFYQYASIEKDITLGFEGIRTALEIKDRLRIIMNTLEPYHSFLIPRNSTNKEIYIPNELLQSTLVEAEQLNIRILPFSQRCSFGSIVYRYCTNLKKFRDQIQLLPEFLPNDPVLEVITWPQICKKSFIGRYRLSESKQDELLKILIANGFVESKKVGVRTYICRSSTAQFDYT